jgi:membrane-associated phospholipid phosphatase
VGALAGGLAIAAAAGLGAARIYDAVADRDGIASLDRPALRLAKRMRSRPVDAGAAGIARAFGPVAMPILTLAAGGVLAARQRHASPLVLVVATAAGSLAMTIAGKDVIHRHRPPRRDAIPPFETSPSFPSGHTLNATTIVGVIAYLLVLHEKRLGPQAAILGAAGGIAVAVGLSRVLLAAHWFTDVVVGWTAGAGWLSLTITAHRLYLTRVSARPRPERS